MLALAASAAAQPAIECSASLRPVRVAELFFGRNTGGRVGVGEAAWTRFVASEITPRFPDGLTVYDARGQWRDPASNRISREPSKVVVIALPGHASDDERLGQIVEAYKARFRQKSVMLMLRPACVGF